MSLYDHVDGRVRDLESAKAFYDAFMSALGLSVIGESADSREYYTDDKREAFFGITESDQHRPNDARVAFFAESTRQVDDVANAIRKAGASRIEGPEVCEEYSQPYYAVFFEDPEGNKFEVCCRR